jgi:spermidine synthase
VGLVGLGIGTLAAYANPGDYYRFYEINPLVEPMARKYFFYLDRCRGKVDVVGGDARLSLDREENQNFDVLVLDAFSGDAIPVHLLTVEAFEIYLRHLAPKGVIAAHISNRHFALRPVVDAIADKYHLTTAAIDLRADQRASLWVLASRDPQTLKIDRIRKVALPPQSDRIVWTDQRASLFEVWLARIDEWIQQTEPGDRSGPRKRFQEPRR